ncbi:adenylate cyclase type 3 [Patella vulgata]|uniref:adenylate cyclase type 3 n=1 Tax=Patella vulgata TaxID=6465 RepID=UPI00218094E1|nr:adenylate cyclase type 3 [Patella vulgata]
MKSPTPTTNTIAYTVNHGKTTDTSAYTADHGKTTEDDSSQKNENSEPPRLACGYFGTAFPDKLDENLYQRFFRRQRVECSVLIVFATVLYCVCVIILEIISKYIYKSNARYFILRIGINCAVLILTTFFHCVDRFSNLFHKFIFYPFIPWGLFFIVVFFDTGSRDINTPSDGLTVTLLLIFVTFLTLPRRLVECCVVAVIICVVHIIIVTIFWYQQHNPFLLGNQIGANVLLCLGSGLLGSISYLYFDRQHRISFLETRSSLSVEVTIEQGHLEQERLLLSVLPKHVADEMIRDWGAMEDTQFRKIYMGRYENVSILFADIVGFTAISSCCTAAELVKILNQLFANFDKLAQKFHQLRIKILGDCYYCICGAPEPRSDHAVLSIHMGLAMVDAIKDVVKQTKKDVNMRVGIHTGAVLGGVLGQKQWQFDVLGKEVTLANQMESSGVPGRVHVSNKTKTFLQDEFELEPVDGGQSDEMIRFNNITTYLVKSVLIPYKENDVLKDKNGKTILDDGDSGKDSDCSRNVDLFNQRLDKTLQNRTFTSFSLFGMSPITLSFVDSKMEMMYNDKAEQWSGIIMIGLCSTLTLTFLAKVCVLPRSLLVILCFIVGVILLALMTFITWPRFMTKDKHVVERFIYCMTNHRILRLLWTIVAVIILFLSDVSGMFGCETGSTYNVSGSNLEPNDVRCQNPVYFIHSTSLILIAITCLMQISHIIKTMLILTVALLVCIFECLIFADIFDSYDNNVYINSAYFPTKYNSLAVLVFMSLILVFISRQMDKIYRRLFFWKVESTKQKEEVTLLRAKNEALIYNILPTHVAKDFIGQLRCDEELYSHSYGHVGVMFASCPNFHDFYNESSINNNGLECLRFLNEIISDYDELLSQPRFSSVCKIKTVGPTYMAASGMTDLICSQTQDIKERWKHLDDLVQFALTMKETLAKINEQSFNHFVLRIGINHGPVIAGVIGARKPHYDIWGNTVNVASRMESTGHPNKIQIVEETKDILENFGYSFQTRGLISVKGKGDLMTYFIKEEPKQTGVIPNQII